MKKSFFVLLAAVLMTAGGSWAQLVGDLDDIQFWVGSGSNRSALVIDFHYGGSGSAIQQSWVWGYRWDGSATGFDMLEAIVAADPNLDVFSPSFVLDIYYSAGSNLYQGEADYDPSVDISWGYYLAGGTAEAFDDDWNPLGQVSISGGGINLPTSWTVSPSGSSDRLLSDGSWDAWSFGAYSRPSFDHTVPPSATAYAAIPEPSSFLLIGLSSILLALRRSKV